MKSKLGRPRFEEGKAKSVMFTLRLTPEEHERLLATAERHEKPVTQWARETLLAACDAPKTQPGKAY